MAHDVRPARDLRSFDATPHFLRRVTGDRARQTTVSRVQGEHLERAETRKVAACEISVFDTDIAVRYRRVRFDPSIACGRGGRTVYQRVCARKNAVKIKILCTSRYRTSKIIRLSEQMHASGKPFTLSPHLDPSLFLSRSMWLQCGGRTSSCTAARRTAVRRARRNRGRAHVALSPPRWGGRPRLLSAGLPRSRCRVGERPGTPVSARAAKSPVRVISRGAPGLRA